MIAKRRAVYTTLSQYFHGDDLLEAMCFWQQEYADAPRHANSKFIMQVLSNTNLVSKHSEIHLKLTSILLDQHTILMPDPLSDMHAYLVRKKGSEYAEKILSSVMQEGKTDAEDKNTLAFEFLVNEFLNRLVVHDEEIFEIVNSAMVNFAKIIAISADQKNELCNWFEGAALNISAEFETITLSSILNAGYVEACKKIGPVLTDKALVDAVKAVEKNASLQDFSPKNLL